MATVPGVTRRRGDSVMAVSGLVLTLSDSPGAEVVLSALAADPRLTFGERFGRRVAVVAETPSNDEDRALFYELRSTPGITNVDVAFVDLEVETGAGENPDPKTPVEDQHAHG